MTLVAGAVALVVFIAAVVACFFVFHAKWRGKEAEDERVSPSEFEHAQPAATQHALRTASNGQNQFVASPESSGPFGFHAATTRGNGAVELQEVNSEEPPGACVTLSRMEI